MKAAADKIKNMCVNNFTIQLKLKFNLNLKYFVGRQRCI